MKSLKIKANELSGDGIEYLQVAFFIAGSDTGGFLLRHIPECGTVLAKCQVLLCARTGSQVVAEKD